MKKVLIIALIGLTMVSCGGKDKKDGADSAKKEVQFKVKKENKATTSADVDGTKLSISSDDMMKYDKKELKAKAGKTIVLTLRHIGKMPKNVMGHNFVLLKKGVDVATFGMKAMNAIDNDYIPEGDETIAYTKLIGGGESVTITFTAPEAGTYDFMCTFPGHYAIMKGKFIVE
ncbi:MAG: azurin [Cellulophaga sp.]